MHFRRLLLTAVALCLAAPVVPADEFTIDPAHTTIGFSIGHLVISKVKGSFNEFTGSLSWDEKAPTPITNATVTIRAASIDTRNEQRDKHLRSDDFFATEKFPELSFVAKKVAQDGKNWMANGTLTIRGVSKEIILPFKVNGPIKDPWGKTRLGIEATTTINRKDFGITWNKALESGGLVVGEEVEIDIQAEFVKQ